MQLNKRLENWQKKGFTAEIGLKQLRIFIIDEGDKNASPDKTLLLFHGFPESSYSYAGALSLLMQRFHRVVLFDFVGFGFSQKPAPALYSYSLMEQADVALEVWRKLGITGGHVLAHDMGTSVLTEILARFHVGQPGWFYDGFKSVTFTNGGMVLSKARLRFGQKALMSRIGKLLSPSLQQYAIFRQQVISAHGNNLLREENIKDLHEAVIFQSWPGLFHYLLQYLYERLRFEQVRWLPAVRQFEGPLHISWGTDDQVNPQVVPEYLKEKVCPQATLSLTPGLGHFCQIQDPAMWVKPLLVFWEKL